MRVAEHEDIIYQELNNELNFLICKKKKNILKSCIHVSVKNVFQKRDTFKM